MTPERPEKIIVRKSDGALFRPSHPDWWTEADAVAATLSGDGPMFYFRGVAWVPGRVLPWPRRGRWVDTGEIWEPASGEFSVVNEWGAR